MNFFLNHALISLNTAPTPQNIFLIIIEKHILMIRNVSCKSSRNSPSVQVLHHQIRGGGTDSDEQKVAYTAVLKNVLVTSRETKQLDHGAWVETKVQNWVATQYYE